MEKNRSQLNIKYRAELLFVIFFLILSIVTGICLHVFRNEKYKTELSGIHVYYDSKDKNIISMISGFNPNTKVDSGELVLDSLENLSDYYEFKDLKEELEYNTTLKNKFGKVHKFTQIYNGVEVYGRGLNVLEDNGILDISGNYLKNIELKTIPSLTIDDVLEKFNKLSKLP